MNVATLINAMPGNISQGIIWGLMALGVFLTFRILDFADLTVDGSFATGGAITVVLMINGQPVWVALIAAAVCGALAGFATGTLHTQFGIPPILAGILTQIALYSVNLNIMGGRANTAISVDKYPLLVSLRFIPKSILVGVVISVILIVFFYWFFGTEIGCAIRATGSNAAMAKAVGISVNKMTVLCLVLSNALVAFAGGLLAQYQGFADINMGRGAIVIGLAAVIIGEVFHGAILGKITNFMVKQAFIILGGVIYYIIIGLVLWLKMPTNNLKLFTAIVVAIFLAVPHIKEMNRNSFKVAGKRSEKEVQ